MSEPNYFHLGAESEYLALPASQDRAGAPSELSRDASQAKPLIPSACRHVNWHHIDGPLMTRNDGTLKWLTLLERLMHIFGFWSLDRIARHRTGLEKLVYHAPLDMHLTLRAEDAHLRGK